MIQGAKKDKKPLAILNYCASTCSGAGKLCVQDVDIASIEERKTFFSAAAQIRFMTKFSQSWEIPFCADKYSIKQKISNDVSYGTDTHDKYFEKVAAEPTQDRCLGAHWKNFKPDFWEGEKNTKIFLWTKLEACSFLHLICQGNRLLFRGEKNVKDSEDSVPAQPGLDGIGMSPRD